MQEVPNHSSSLQPLLTLTSTRPLPFESPTRATPTVLMTTATEFQTINENSVSPPSSQPEITPWMSDWKMVALMAELEK